MLWQSKHSVTKIDYSGTKIEGILRQSADVEEVDRRVQEYEQGCHILYFHSQILLVGR